MSAPLRVATVLPVPSSLDLAVAVEAWPTATSLVDALAATGRVAPVAVALGPAEASLERRGVHHVAAVDTAGLVRAVATAAPDVVHVHGTRAVGLIARLRRALGPEVPIVVQHHGEPPGPLANRLAHRVLRPAVAGWLLTGAHEGQADPFRRAGLIGPRTPVFEVLEASSTLPTDDGAPAVRLDGTPSLLWVGRLTVGKDPLAAVRALSLAPTPSGAHLHLLATDRTLAPAVTLLAERLGVAARVHVHDPVPAAQMHRWYRGADVVVSTSRHEGSNYSLVEALHHGCTPVVSDLPSHRAIVGALAPRFADAAGAARLLARGLLDRTVVVEHAARHLSWAAVAEQALAAYDAVLSSARRS